MESNWIARLEIPVLDLQSRQGNTDYIDFIDLDEMKEPAYKGIDLFKRYFTCVKFRIEFFNESDNSTIIEKRFQTFFQRYTNGDMYIGCGHSGVNLMSTYGGMTSGQIKTIEDVIKGSVSLDKEQSRVLRIVDYKVPEYTKCVISLDN